jgi:chitodextrinase
VVTASAVTHNAFTLDWDAASDDTAVTKYRYRLNAGAWSTLGNVLTVNVTGATPGTSYAVDVQAGDAADNWSASLSLADVTTDSLALQPVIYNPSTVAVRDSVTGLKVLVLDEAPGSTATPTVLAYSTTESTDVSGVLYVDLNSSGKDPADIVWLIVVKSDGVPANAGWSVCWPQAVEAIPA